MPTDRHRLFAPTDAPYMKDRNANGTIKFPRELKAPIPFESLSIRNFLDPKAPSPGAVMRRRAYAKLGLLYRFFGLEWGAEGAAEELALRIAEELIPGFAVTRKRGRHNASGKSDLIRDIEALVSAKGVTRTEACRQLSRRSKYKGKTSRALYGQFKREFARWEASPISAARRQMEEQAEK